MRALALFAAFLVLVGCSTGPAPSRDTQARADAAKNTQRVKITPVVGATVEDSRHRGVMLCATCGGPVDDKGACPRCNALGMPGFGIAPTGKVRRSTSPR